MGNRIVFLINTLKVGGAAKMLKYVANLSTKLFTDITIISMYDDSYEKSDLKEDINVSCLGFDKVNRFKRHFIMVSQTKKAIKKHNPDIVCSFISHVCFIGRLATYNNKKIKYISAERGDPFTESLLWKKLLEWTYSKSDYCFFQLERARDYFGAKVVNKSFVIPNPVILDKIVEPYIGQRKKTIVSAGRFAPEKRYCDLIEAFSIIRKKYPDYSLTIYGNGPMLGSYRKQVKDLGLENSVFFPGYVDCFSQHIREDGIFVLSSLFEGIPNALIEAMIVGIPCIATDCTPGGPAFLFDNETRGILVPVKKPEAIANAILKYIENPELAKRNGKLAFDIVNQLKEETIRMKWLEAFETILNYESLVSGKKSQKFFENIES